MTAQATMAEVSTTQGQAFGHRCRVLRVTRYRVEEIVEGGVVEGIVATEC
jgi:hypothetical protein